MAQRVCMVLMWLLLRFSFEWYRAMVGNAIVNGIWLMVECFVRVLSLAIVFCIFSALM